MTTNWLGIRNQKQQSQRLKRNLTHTKVPQQWQHRPQQKSTTPKTTKSAKSLQKSSTVQDDNAKCNTSGYLGVMALIAIMEPATEGQKFSRKKLPLVSHPSNKIKVLLDSGSDGDLYFLQKEQTNTFLTWKGSCQSLGILQMGASKQMEGLN